MKILILGAGQVGSSVAQVFSKESQNEITVVDLAYAPLVALKERYDLRTIRGNAALPTILEEADAENTDIIIAATSSDEVNIIACHLAHTLFNIELKVARIREQAYVDYSESILFGAKLEAAFAIDVVISPEILITDQIKNIIELPGAQEVLRFAKGRAVIVAAEIHPKSEMANRPLTYLHNLLPDTQINLVALFREDQELTIDADLILRPHDELYFLCERPYARQIMLMFNHANKIPHNIVIAGGGNIGRQLAETLERFAHVKVIEHNRKSAQRLSAYLNDSLVLMGDCTDENLLFEENIEETDIFCAVTNDDQTNILSSMLAKRLGAKYVITLINRSSFLELIQEESNIDLAFSPQQVTVSTLLTYIRKGDIAQVYSIRDGEAEVIEIVAHGTEENSKIINRVVNEIKWPDHVNLAGIIRHRRLLKIDETTAIEPNDHIVLFITDKESIPKVEDLFKIN